MAVIRRHPNRKQLGAWLNGELDAETEIELDRHLDTCTRCAATLEADETEHTPIGEHLTRLLSPPSGLTDRLERRVNARLDSRIMFDVVSDLFGAGFEASRLLLTEDQIDG